MKNLHKKIILAISMIIVLSICIIPLTGCKVNKLETEEDSSLGLIPLSADVESIVMDAVEACWGDKKLEIFELYSF